MDKSNHIKNRVLFYIILTGNRKKKNPQVRSRTPFSQVSSSLAHGLSRVSLRGTLPRLSLAEARGNSVRPALFSSRPIKPRFSVAPHVFASLFRAQWLEPSLTASLSPHASASLRHRLSVGISRNMPSGTPLMLRSLRHLPPLPHDCPAEIERRD